MILDIAIAINGAKHSFITMHQCAYRAVLYSEKGIQETRGYLIGGDQTFSFQLAIPKNENRNCCSNSRHAQNISNKPNQGRNRARSQLYRYFSSIHSLHKSSFLQETRSKNSGRTTLSFQIIVIIIPWNCISMVKNSTDDGGHVREFAIIHIAHYTSSSIAKIKNIINDTANSTSCSRCHESKASWLNC